MFMTAEDEDGQDIQDWAEANFKAMKNKMESLANEMRNNKPRENINVRRVSSDNLKNHDDDQIIVEYKVERWYSINYFKQMINNDNDSQNQGNSSIF